MHNKKRQWRTYPLMAAVASVIAIMIVRGYDRYMSPDRIDEKPLLNVDYFDINNNQTQHQNDLDQFFQKELLQELEPRHGSPAYDTYSDKHNTICYAFRNVCDRIHIVDALSEREQYLYTAIPLYLIYYMDRYGDFDYMIEDVIAKIAISAGAGRRGYANHDSVIIYTEDIGSMREYLEIMTHELGHVIDLGAVTGTMRRKNTTYTEFGRVQFALDDPSIDYYQLSWDDETTRSAGQTRDDFCSGYGQRNPFEDFAECMNLYMNHHDLFVHITHRSRTLARKYTYIKRLFDGFYIYRDTASVRKYTNPHDFYVFDTSKIWE